LLTALAQILLEAGAVDSGFIAEHTSGFAELRAALQAQDLASLSKQCGIAAPVLHQVAHWIGRKRFLSFFAMGIGQSTWGVRKIQALINLHLLTGTIGRPGCGPFSLTGQPNAMGGREVGLLSHQLPGYRFVNDAEHRAEVEEYWGLPAGSIDARPGLTAVQMFRALEREQLKAIWIAATNPLVSMPDLHHLRRALGKAELVIVQDAFHPTETTQWGDILLPAASWGEREWISTNSERMVAYSEKLVEPPGAALPDWEIFCRFAGVMGFAGFEFASAGAVWDEWIGLSAGRPCDMSGMPFERLRRQRQLQWPCPRLDHPGTKRLYWEGRFGTEDGRARFVVVPATAPKEATDHEFPLVLTTGRVYSHWHTLTRTGKVRKLVERSPAPFVAIHPTVAARLGLTEGEVCQVSSRRGTVRLPVTVSDRVPPEVAFVPMHWGDLYSPGNAVNYLTLSAIGRIARQPELKYCAVAVERVGPTAAPAPASSVLSAADHRDRQSVENLAGGRR
jgi:ferredoxin-nitrate reductase